MPVSDATNPDEAAMIAAAPTASIYLPRSMVMVGCQCSLCEKTRAAWKRGEEGPDEAHDELE